MSSYCKLKSLDKVNSLGENNNTKNICPFCRCLLLSQSTKKTLKLYAFDKIHYQYEYTCCNCNKHFYIFHNSNYEKFAVFDEVITSVKFVFDKLSNKYLIIPHAEVQNLIKINKNNIQQDIYTCRNISIIYNINNIQYGLFHDLTNIEKYYLLVPSFKCNECSQYDFKIYKDQDYCKCESNKKTYKVYTDLKVSDYETIKNVKDLLDAIKSEVQKMSDTDKLDKNIHDENIKVSWYKKICKFQ